MRYSFELLRYIFGLRAAATALTADERNFIGRLVESRKRLVEVGVHEGATSAVLCARTPPYADVLLVDHYPARGRFERLVGISGARWIAGRTVRRWKGKVRFVELPSLAAASLIAGESAPDFVFIDADHAYEAARADFRAWGGLLQIGGTICLHDSAPCSMRSDLSASTGPVRVATDVQNGHYGDWELLAVVDSISAFLKLGSA